MRRLVRLNNNWPRLARELRDLLSRRDTLKDFLTLARGSMAAPDYAALMEEHLAQAVAHILKPLAAGLSATELGRRWPQFLAALQESGMPDGMTLTESPPEATVQDLCVWQGLAEVLLTKAGTVRKKLPGCLAGGDWPGAICGLAPEFVARLKDCRKVPRELFAVQEVGALQDLILLLNAAWEIYDELCRKRGVLDFITVEEAALRLLSAESPADLLLRLDWRLRHILVDEFQDTSDNQKELLCRLLSGWSAGDGRTLTVVGDPKQSIYGWRQARLHLFLESREGLTCGGRRVLPLTPLSLTTNFRATPALITWVNRVAGGTVMADPKLSGGLVFAPAYPAPGREGGEAPCLALFSHEDTGEARAQEARWLTQRIIEARADLPEGKHLALLLFSRRHLPTYLGALQAAGLVPRVREGLKLTESRVVQHLHNLARALVRPQDDVAWARLLTGPWAEPDLAVVAGCARAPGAVWPEKLAAFTTSPACPAATARLAQLLLAARERVGREALGDIVERFLEETSAWTGVAAWEGALGVASARTYLKLVAESEAGLPEATFLKADFALPGAYQPSDPRAEDSPVEVLTVHGAKGLEFHTVFLPFLDWQPLKMEGNQPAPFLLEEIPGTRTHVLGLAPPAWQAGGDSSCRLVANLKQERVLAEARRVFYVAVTRAQTRLFLSGVLPVRKSGAAPPPDSPLAWLWQHYRPGGLTSGVQLWPDPPLRVEALPELNPIQPPDIGSKPPPPPWDFTPETPPYSLSFPSREAAEAWSEGGPATGTLPGGGLESRVARARGEVTHRLLQSLARGGKIPDATGAVAALAGFGVDREKARELAPEILAEVAACLTDPFLAPLLHPDAAESEWGLEDQPAPGIIRRGRVDLLAFDGKIWWLVDFKTSRPPAGVSWDDFLLKEREKYRPQLIAYREMTVRVKGLATPGDVRLALYFTAGRQAVEL